MADYYFDPDPANNPPADYDTDGALKLTAGTAIIGLTLTRDANGGIPGVGIRALGIQDITLISGATIRSQSTGIEFAAQGTNRLFNSNGFIWSLSGSAVRFSQGGEGIISNQGAIQGRTGIEMTGTGGLQVFNSGVITATGTETEDNAIRGGKGSDRVVNTGIIRSVNSDVAIDLDEGDDIYEGGGGSVIGKVLLGKGNDTAYGGSGDETFSGGQGNDYIHGGAGIDTVDYSDATGSVTVDLRQSVEQSIGGNHDRDTLISIENVIGGDHNDRLIGNDDDNYLQGGKGDDTLEGGAGNDTLDGGEGDKDWVRYTGTAAVTVNLGLTHAQDTGGYGKDTLYEIEHVEGGGGSDTITGNDKANELIGNGGNDTFQGGKGDDTIDGGQGNDMAVFSGKREEYEFPINVDGDNVEFTVKDLVADRDGTDKLKNVRFLKFLGDPNTSDDDVIIAVRNQNPSSITLSTSSVREDATSESHIGYINGSDPDEDSLTYSLSNDAGGRFKLNGTQLLVNGAFDYESATSHEIVVRAVDKWGGEFFKTITVNVTNVIEYTPIVRTGTAASDRLTGESGNDWFSGLGGNDSLYGSNGNDSLYGGDGDDLVVGGDSDGDEANGNDLLDGGNGNDRLYGCAGNDTVYGGEGNDVVVGGNGDLPSGDDLLYGGNGADTLYGGDGSDVLYGGNGNDMLNGGSGRDTFVFDMRPNARTNIDNITDFSPADDTIHLARSAFNKISKGTLAKKAFVVGNKVKDRDDRIIYDKKSGALFYDPDGTGKAKAVQFAMIQKNLALTHKDFFIF
ncbi:calcium-binding protein [Microvirga guangxiensis]|uniref:Ca2+-binding protein, RTX toxin-related n=1 Tax=Microvirga guangxiensis TaxID=549386 RepID=A0A1G5DMK3_9HYPH|nr:calcium-binding protein [Microvirga guangxiensis]SCY15904.1 Ca2+-binding protein, RTX toxin-related [Microvirga guangxiensis]